MNAPWHWELRKECLTDIGNCKKSVLPTLGTEQKCLTDVGASANTLAAQQREWVSSVQPLKKPRDKNKNATYP